ncbi:MAG: flagellar export chaperone FliS [Mariprofundaceae bacterium]
MAGYKTYRGNQVEGTGPLGLILLTYDSLHKSLLRARRAIEAGDLAAEADHSGRSLEALIELTSSLDMEKGGEVAVNLSRLYTYMNKRLTDGMCSCSTAAIDEVIDLTQSLREGWQQMELAQKREEVRKRGNSQPIKAPKSYSNSSKLAAYAG